jgi:hypothetical protein
MIVCGVGDASPAPFCCPASIDERAQARWLIRNFSPASHRPSIDGRDAYRTSACSRHSQKPLRDEEQVNAVVSHETPSIEKENPMRSFNMKKLLCLAIVGGSACSAALPANAMQIPYQTPAQMKATCTAAGGDYMAPGGKGVYGCQLKNGAVISCGGVGAHAKTCSNPARGQPAPKGPVLGGSTPKGPVLGGSIPKGPVLGGSTGTNGGGKPVVKPISRR